MQHVQQRLPALTPRPRPTPNNLSTPSHAPHTRAHKHKSTRLCLIPHLAPQPPKPTAPQTYRDGGPGALRPLAVRLGGSPVPGVCAGLQDALLGMRVGGRRVVAIPPERGFGDRPALAPYAVVPPGSGVRYEVQLLRLSRRGPDARFKVRVCVWGGECSGGAGA